MIMRYLYCLYCLTFLVYQHNMEHFLRNCNSVCDNGGVEKYCVEAEVGTNQKLPKISVEMTRPTCH